MFLLPAMVVMAGMSSLGLWNVFGRIADPPGGTGGGVTDADLIDLTKRMFRADGNCVGDKLTINSDRHARGPLFVSVLPSALSGPTMSALAQLQENYNPGVTGAREKNAFLDAVMATDVMRLAGTFLHNKNLLTGSLRNKLDEIWFTMYFRGRNVRSSGFKHVFMGELKNGKVAGFHNWVYFQNEEANRRLDTVRRIYYKNLGPKGSIIKLRFHWMTEPKEIGSMFIGTSPELEMATYTVCFLARPASPCLVQMNSEQFQIKTFTWTYNGLVLVSSAFPYI